MKLPTKRIPTVLVAIAALIAQAGCSATPAATPKIFLCDEHANRYDTAEEALAAGLDYAQFGATYCPEYKMHPSWDANRDGENDCYDDGSCSADADYMSPRPN